MTDKPETGEVVLYEGRSVDLKAAKPIQTLTWPAVEVIGLKYHPEYSGRKIVLVKIDIYEGEYGEQAKVGALLLKEDGKVEKPILIITSASDLLARFAAVESYVNSGNAVAATLRSSGRAWLLE